MEPIWQAGSTGNEWVNQQRDRYVDGNPYEDFNEEKDGEGYWWTSTYDSQRITESGINDCNEPYFWVDTGDTPDVDDAITPQILAQLAYREIRVPDTEVELSPQQKQTVNLATWAWLDKATYSSRCRATPTCTPWMISSPTSMPSSARARAVRRSHRS